MVIHTGEVSPTRITSNLYQTCTQHNSKEKPAITPNAYNWGRQKRRVLVKGKQGDKKYSEKSGFERLAFPAK